METKPRSNVPAGRVYEDFEPSIEWAREPGFDTLLVYLPGFKKEQLKVQVTSSGSLRISGERQLTDNRWSRFRKEIPISSNCDPNEISARHEKGILFVKQPKLIVPDAAKLQDQELPRVGASKPDQKPPQENAQPPTPASSKPEQRSQEKVQPPSESGPKPEKQPRETSEQLIEASKNEQMVGMEKRKGGKIEGVANANDNASAKTPRKKEPAKYEWTEKSTNTAQAEAEAKGIATTSKSPKPENLDDSSLDSTKMDKDKAATGLLSGTEKLRTENYKKAFTGLVMDTKQPRKLVNLVLLILSVVVLAMYGRNAIRSFKKSEN